MIRAHGYFLIPKGLYFEKKDVNMEYFGSHYLFGDNIWNYDKPRNEITKIVDDFSANHKAINTWPKIII
jgi:uncharacterized protein (DUF427 family)